MRNRQAGLVFIFVTILIDVLGLGIIIPILPHLVQELAGGDVSSASTYFGVFVAVFAAMQFLFAPVLGSLSDRFGRRPIILLSLFGAGVDYILMALAPNLAWLFVGRVIAGITAASFTVANAYIADVSPPHQRAQNFGLVGAAFGLGFIVGPALGGLAGTWGPRVPFLVAAALTLLNWLYGFFVLPESLQPENRRPFSWARANAVGSLKALGRYPVVLGLTGMLVANSLAQQGMRSTWLLYTTYCFDWSTLQTGLSLAAFGISLIVMQGVVIGSLIPKLGERRAVIIGLAFNALGFVLYALATQGWMLYAVMIGTALGFMTQPAAQGLISRQVPPNEQGSVQGAVASLFSLTGIFGPILMTSLFGHFTGGHASVEIPGIAFFVSAACCVLALLLALRSFRRTGVSPAPAAPVGVVPAPEA